MKFYYLPYHLGFMSFSKNHFTLYNETQEAKSIHNVNNSNAIKHWLREYQSIKDINRNVEHYHKNKHKKFEEIGLIAVNWIIK